MRFEWDPQKASLNLEKHDVSFSDAVKVFEDEDRLIEFDTTHSKTEKRYHCYGWVEGRVLTVRFTVRAETVRIIGAAYWRKGKKKYEQKNNL